MLILVIHCQPMIEASLCTRDIDGGSYGHPTVETLFVGTKVCGENESNRLSNICWNDK